MYIFEKILRWIFPNKLNKEYNYDPLKQYEEDDDENCEHEFMPVDSTGEVCACIKCGFIVNVKKENIED